MNIKMDQQLAEEELRKAAAIYTKPGLSDYQQCVNDAALKLCQKNPTVIRNRAELLRLAREEVHESGYMYKKSKSRSKRFGISETTPKRPKSDREFRVRQMKELEEDLEGLNKRITIKETRCEAGAASKNFKLCDQLADEIASLKQQRREKEAESRVLERKEKKSKWYLKKKRSSQTDDSDVMESSDDSELAGSGTASKRSRSSTPKTPPFRAPQPSSPSPYPCSETGDSRATSVSIPSDEESQTSTSATARQHFSSGLPAKV